MQAFSIARGASLDCAASVRCITPPMNPLLRPLVLPLITSLWLAGTGPALAQEKPAWPDDWDCGPAVVRNRVAPMDYRTNKKMLELVEAYHFRPHVEALVKPMFTHFGADLDYTLHAFPNHHRALITLVRLGEREKTDQPKGTQYTIDCFFRRAVRFRSDDLVVRMIYAQYLNKNGRRPEALGHLDFVGERAADNPLTHYNAGLIYLEAEQFDKALLAAHRAQALGLQRQELKAALVQAGKWREPDSPGSAPEVHGAASAAAN